MRRTSTGSSACVLPPCKLAILLHACTSSSMPPPADAPRTPVQRVSDCWLSPHTQWQNNHLSYNLDVRKGPVHVEWFKGKFK